MSENHKDLWPVPAKLTASLADCSEDMVNKVRRGDKGKRNSKKSKAVKAVDAFLNEGKSRLLKEVKKIVKL